MGPAVSCDRPYFRPPGSSSLPHIRPPVVRILRGDGNLEIYFTPVTAQEVMLRHPKHLVTRLEALRSDSKKTLIPPEALLVPGMKFYLVPHRTVLGKFHDRQVVLERSRKSSTSPHPPVKEQSPAMAISPSNGKRRRGGDGGADKSPSRSIAGQGDGEQSTGRKSASVFEEVATGDGQRAASCGEAPIHVERSPKRTISAEVSARVSCGGSEGGTTPGRLEELGDGELLVGGENEKNTKTEDDLSKLSKTQVDEGVSDEPETEPLLRKERCRRMTLGQILGNTNSAAPPRLSDKVAIDSVLEHAEASTPLVVAISPSPIADKTSQKDVMEILDIFRNNRKSTRNSIKPLGKLAAVIQRDRNPLKLDSVKPIKKLDPILMNPKLDSLKPVEKKNVREMLGDHFANPASLRIKTQNTARDKTNVRPLAASSRSAASVESSSSSLLAATTRKPPLSCGSPSRKSNPRCKHQVPLTILGFNSMKSDNPSIITQCRLHKRACLLLASLSHRATPSPRPAARTPASPDCRLDKMITDPNPPALNFSNPSSPQRISQQQRSSTSPAHHRQQLTSQKSLASSSGHRQKFQSRVYTPFSRPHSMSRRLRDLNYRRSKPLSPILETSP